MQMRLCEVCHQRVSVCNDGYGTHYYVGMEQWAILQKVAKQLKRLAADPNIQSLSATNALTYASTAILIDRPTPEPEKAP